MPCGSLTRIFFLYLEIWYDNVCHKLSLERPTPPTIWSLRACIIQQNIREIFMFTFSSLVQHVKALQFSVSTFVLFSKHHVFLLAKRKHQSCHVLPERHALGQKGSFGKGLLALVAEDIFGKALITASAPWYPGRGPSMVVRRGRWREGSHKYPDSTGVEAGERSYSDFPGCTVAFGLRVVKKSPKSSAWSWLSSLNSWPFGAYDIERWDWKLFAHHKFRSNHGLDWWWVFSVNRVFGRFWLTSSDLTIMNPFFWKITSQTT